MPKAYVLLLFLAIALGCTHYPAHHSLSDSLEAAAEGLQENQGMLRVEVYDVDETPTESVFVALFEREGAPATAPVQRGGGIWLYGPLTCSSDWTLRVTITCPSHGDRVDRITRPLALVSGKVLRVVLKCNCNPDDSV